MKWSDPSTFSQINIYELHAQPMFINKVGVCLVKYWSVVNLLQTSTGVWLVVSYVDNMQLADNL